MNYLCFDTSGNYLSVIAEYNGESAEAYLDQCKLNHSVMLLPTIEGLLNKLKMQLSDVDVFGCCIGAGSFTGIRIGVSTVKAYCDAFKKKAIRVTTFDIMAYNKPEGKNLCVIDAGHSHYYICGYIGCEKQGEEKYCSIEEVLSLSKEYKLLCLDSIPELVSKGLPFEVVSKTQGFRKAVEKNINQAVPADEINPLYIRKSQAEENR